MKTNISKKLMVTILLVAVFMVVLSVTGKVQAATSIADEFEESFVNAIINSGKYGITSKDDFTKEWATTITKLELSNMSIGGIDKGGTNPNVLGYFSNLEVLDVSNNNLGGLPYLPSTLKELNCENNNITALPALSGNLTVLDCSDNKITVLPAFSGTLTTLDCSNNNIAVLPEFPGTLTTLNIKGNSGITSIAASQLPSSLTKFETDLIVDELGNYSVDGKVDNSLGIEEEAEEEKDDTPKTGTTDITIYAWIAIIAIVMIIALRQKEIAKHSK